MAYIGNAPVLQTTQFRDEFFPTSNQTAFTTGGFHPSAVSVTRNGVLLSESDYTKGSDNVTITLANAAVSGDVIVIYGNRSLAQGVSVSESRVEYTWQSGDTAVQLNADVIPAYTDVYLNGVKLAAADYSINASTKQVSFTSAPAVGDVIAVVHKNEASALVALPLKDSQGNNVLSESGGTVTLASSVIGSVQGFESYRFDTPDLTANGVLSGFTLLSSAPYGSKGSILSESSGIWSFSETGKYLILANFQLLATSQDTVVVYIKVATDGSTFNNAFRGQCSLTSNVPNTNLTITAILDCTNTTNFLFQFYGDSIATGSKIRGGTDNYTYFNVIKIG